jgi:hypothetical protein
MGDEIKLLAEQIEKLGERLERRFDVLAGSIHEQGTRIALIEAKCERHGEDDERRAQADERRDRKISQMAAKVEDRRESSVNVVPQPSAADVVRLLDEREEARAKRHRAWLVTAVPIALALLATPTVRQCMGEERAARVEQAVQRLESKPPAVVKVPVPQPVPVPVPAPSE